MKRFKKGFTLAEVLITLSIIGIIAAIVMPTVISSYQYKTIGVKLSKFAASTEQSARAYVVSDGSFDTRTTAGKRRILDFINDSFLITGVTNTTNQATYLADLAGVSAATITPTEAQQASTFAFDYQSGTNELITAALTNLTTNVEITRTAATADTPETYTANPTGNYAILKDGTYVTFAPITAAQYTNHPAAVNTNKVGLPAIDVTFIPNVSGLSQTAQKQFHFVITELGYVVPHDMDACLWEIYQADWATNSKMFAEGRACNGGLAANTANP